MSLQEWEHVKSDCVFFFFFHTFHREMGDRRISPASGVTAVEAKLAILVQSDFTSLLATF